MFEPEIAYVEEMEEAIEFYRDLVAEASSYAPGSIGMNIRVEVLESNQALLRALYYITVEQLWENQIDMYGVKAPFYKPNTIRQKRKLIADPPHTPDKLINYTQRWSGRFYEHGIYIWVNAANDEYRFEKDENAVPHAAFIPDNYVGMTEENFQVYEEEMSELVEREQKRYIRNALRSSKYYETIRALQFLGYDFDN